MEMLTEKSICIHCEHSCHCDMMCTFHEDSKICKCDECNCRPSDWGETTIDME